MVVVAAIEVVPGNELDGMDVEVKSDDVAVAETAVVLEEAATLQTLSNPKVS